MSILYTVEELKNAPCISVGMQGLLSPHFCLSRMGLLPPGGC